MIPVSPLLPRATHATAPHPPGDRGGEPEEDRSAILPLVAILILIAVPVSLAVWAAAGSSIWIAAAGVVAIAACLAALVVGLVRLMGDAD